MTSRPGAYHQALVAGARDGRRDRWPVPAAAATVLAVEAVLGTLGTRAPDLAAWVVLVLVAGLGLVLAGLRRLPEPRAVRRALGTGAPRAAGVVLERVLLLAACVALAAGLVGLAVPTARPWETVIALVLTAAVLVAHLTAPGEGRRRAVVAAGWCGAAVLVVLVVAAAAGLATGAVAEGPDPRTAAAGGGVLAVLVAGALGGVLLGPALPGLGAGRSFRGLPRVLAAGAGVLAVLVTVAAGVPTGGEPALVGLAASGTPAALVRAAAVALAVVLLVAAATALTGRGEVLRRSRTAVRPADRTAAVVLTAVAAAVVALTAADVGRLVACYAVVVLALTVHTLATGSRLWRRALDSLYQPAARRRARAGRLVTGVACVAAAALLVLAAVPGWPAVPTLAAVSAMMWGVSRHDRELSAALSEVGKERPLPTTVRAFVVVDAVDRPAVRAVSYARALRATSIEAITVPGGPGEAESTRADWAALDVPVPLVELAAPPGDPGAAVVEHVTAARRAEPSGIAVVYLPEVTAASRWRRLLLGRRAARLRARLLALPGTVVTTVPWPLEENQP